MRVYKAESQSWKIVRHHTEDKNSSRLPSLHQSENDLALSSHTKRKNVSMEFLLKNEDVAYNPSTQETEAKRACVRLA